MNEKNSFITTLKTVLYVLFPIAGFIAGLAMYAMSSNKGLWIFSKEFLLFAPFIFAIVGFGVGFLLGYVVDLISIAFKKINQRTASKRSVALINIFLILVLVLNIFLLLYSIQVNIKNWDDISNFWSQISDDFVTAIFEIIISLFFYPISVLFRNVFDPSLRTLFIIIAVYSFLFAFYFFSSSAFIYPSDREGYILLTVDGDTGAVLNKKEVTSESLAIRDNLLIGLLFIFASLLLSSLFLLFTTVLIIIRLVKNIKLTISFKKSQQ